MKESFLLPDLKYPNGILTISVPIHVQKIGNDSFIVDAKVEK
jgi:hypothetical protein